MASRRQWPASRPPRPPFIPPIGPLSPLSPRLHQWCAPAPAAALCADGPGRATGTLYGSGPGPGAPRPPWTTANCGAVQAHYTGTPAAHQSFLSGKPRISVGPRSGQHGSLYSLDGRTDGWTDKTTPPFTTSTSGRIEDPWTRVKVWVSWKLSNSRLVRQP